jgi:hypothetical protein
MNCSRAPKTCTLLEYYDAAAQIHRIHIFRKKACVAFHLCSTEEFLSMLLERTMMLGSNCSVCLHQHDHNTTSLHASGAAMGGPPLQHTATPPPLKLTMKQTHPEHH